MDVINIWWKGPVSLKDIENKKVGIDENEDYGIYQIYGAHPVYGHNVLLYIGKAVQQTFSKRLNQEEHWWSNQDSSNLQVYLGRLIGDTPSNVTLWDEQIGKAEKLLIYAHRPAHNSSNINSIKDDEVSNTHVLNWGEFKSLLPEISSMKILDETNETNNNFFNMEHCKS